MGPLWILALGASERLMDRGQIRKHALSFAFAVALFLPTSISEIAFQIQTAKMYQAADRHNLPEAEWYGVVSKTPDVHAVPFLDTCGWKFETQYFSFTRPRILKASVP